MPPASVEATVAKHDKANVLFIVFVPPDNLPGRSVYLLHFKRQREVGKYCPVCYTAQAFRAGMRAETLVSRTIELLARRLRYRKCPAETAAQGENFMLYTIAVILVILWLLGMVTSYTVGGLIHILLALAIISVLIRVIQGRNPL
jgi:hypothetical protein